MEAEKSDGYSAKENSILNLLIVKKPVENPGGNVQEIDERMVLQLRWNVMWTETCSCTTEVNRISWYSTGEVRAQGQDCINDEYLCSTNMCIICLDVLKHSKEI